jgi:acetoacetyl-CoA synthetase
VLFVQLAGGAELTSELVARITADLRSMLSPRHVPDELYSVPSIPRTHSGKKLEVPVKRILTGSPAASVVSEGSLADPGALEPFVEISRSPS